MSVFKVHKTKTNFTIVQNELLCDPNLDGTTKWLIVYCHSKPSSWKFAAERIARETADGVHAIRSAMTKARQHGWMKVYNIQESDGRLTKCIEVTDEPWIFSSNIPDETYDFEMLDPEPSRGFPSSDSPSSEVPSSENRDCNKELIPSRTDLERTEVSNVDLAINGCSPDAVTKKPSEEALAAKRIYDHWISTFGRSPSRATFTPTRKAKLVRWLREYSEQDLLDVISGVSILAHNQGYNNSGKKYTDFELLFRDHEHIQRYMETWQDPTQRRKAEEHLRRCQAKAGSSQSNPFASLREALTQEAAS